MERPASPARCRAAQRRAAPPVAPFPLAGPRGAGARIAGARLAALLLAALLLAGPGADARAPLLGPVPAPAPGALPLADLASYDALPPGAGADLARVGLAIDLASEPGVALVAQETALPNDEPPGSAPWTEVVLRLLPLLAGAEVEASGLEVDGRPVEPLPSDDPSVLRVPLPAPVPPGGEARVALSLRIEPPGAGGPSYGIVAWEDVGGPEGGPTVALAHAWAVPAPRGPGGWIVGAAAPHGDLAFARAAWILAEVAVPAGWRVAASGRTVSDEILPDPDGTGDVRVLRLEAGPARDLYLAASPDYGVREATADVGGAAGTRVRLLHRPSEAAGAEAALDAAVAALELMAERYGPYPYRELELATVPTGALGIEFPGAIALNRELVADGPSMTLEGTVAHEVAHQWFYGLVGSDPLGEPWLDESLTQMATLLYFRDRYGEQGEAAFEASLASRWERIGRAPLPLAAPAASFSGREYGAIVYGMGPLALTRIEDEIGPEAFAAGLRAYVDGARFGIATGSDLRGALEAACGCDLEVAFDRWWGEDAVPRPGGQAGSGISTAQ